MAGIGIENYASDHDMSNQQSEKPDLPQHKPGSPWENWSLPTNFAASLFGTLGPFQTLRASGYLQLRSFTCFALQVLYLAWYRGAKFTKNKNDQWSCAANPWFITHRVLQGTEASLLELRRFMTLGGVGVPDSPNTTG